MNTNASLSKSTKTPHAMGRKNGHTLAPFVAEHEALLVLKNEFCTLITTIMINKYFTNKNHKKTMKAKQHKKYPQTKPLHQIQETIFDVGRYRS